MGLFKKNINKNIPEFFYKKEYIKLFQKYNINLDELLFYNVPENYLQNFFYLKNKNNDLSIDDLMYFSDENSVLIDLGFNPNSINSIKEYKVIFDNINIIKSNVSVSFIENNLDNINELLRKKSFIEIFSSPKALDGLKEIFDNNLIDVIKELPIKKVISNLTYFSKIELFHDYSCYYTIINYLTNLHDNKKNKVLNYMISIIDRLPNMKYADMFIRVYIDNEKYQSNIDELLIEENINLFNSCLFTSEIFPKIVDSNFKDKLYSFLSPVEKETVFISSYEYGIGSIKERVLEINRRDAKYEPYINYLELFYNFNYTDEDFTKLLYLSKRKQFKKFLKVLFVK